MTKQSPISRYSVLVWRTLVYARHVRGTTQAPSTYLIAAAQTRTEGAKKTVATARPPRSDLYRLRAPEGIGVTLQDLVGAFLTSPLFRLELAILSRAAVPPPLRDTLLPSHLERVAANQADSFGNWKDRLARGDPGRSVQGGDDDGACSSPAPTRIMRCHTNGGEPFCDTWWSVEPSRDEPGTVDLVFGTALLLPLSRVDDSSRKWKAWTLAALDPFHRLYSRLLLASARANLETRNQQRQQGTACERKLE